jgi:probable O-glycosylation ligase (exosortase A-associated)
VSLRGIVLAIFLLGSLPVCFLRPFYGIALWTIMAFVNPHSYAWGVETWPWAQMIILPTIAGVLAFNREGWDALKTREGLLVIALWGWFSITTLASINDPMFQHHAEDTIQRWTEVSKILFVTILTIVLLNSFERLRRFALVLAGCFGIFILKSLPFVLMTGGAYRIYGPPDSMIADNNDFGLALNMTLPLFFFLAQAESRPWLKRVLVFLAFATIPAILFTYSRGALVGLLGMGALMFIRLPMQQRFLLTPVILIGLTLAAVFAPESWQYRMKSITNYSMDSSAQGRLNAWRFSINLAADYPISGGGFGTFTEELYSRYSFVRTGEALTAHSVYFQVLADHGYVGLFLYLVLMGSAFLTTSRLYKQAEMRDDSVAMRYANMFRFSLVGFAASGAFLSRAYFDYFFCIVACIAVLKNIAQQSWSQDEAKQEDAEENIPAGDHGEYVFPQPREAR